MEIYTSIALLSNIVIILLQVGFHWLVLWVVPFSKLFAKLCWIKVLFGSTCSASKVKWMQFHSIPQDMQHSHCSWETIVPINCQCVYQYSHSSSPLTVDRKRWLMCASLESFRSERVISCIYVWLFMCDTPKLSLFLTGSKPTRCIWYPWHYCRWSSFGLSWLHRAIPRSSTQRMVPLFWPLEHVRW